MIRQLLTACFRSSDIYLSSALLLILTSSPLDLRAQDAGNGDRVDFAQEVLPVLSDKCFICHGPDTKKKGLLRLDSSERATRDLGGYMAIDRDSPGESAIILRLHDAKDPMPPEDADKQLSDAEREIITRWVRQGGRYAKHWSLELPKKSIDTAPELAIDTYILKGMSGKGREKKSIDFAPETDRATLARRAALVLTGLPPEPEWLDEFLANSDADAYAKFIDRLLANFRYGEHQARYWLDAVRYGDTHGLHLDNRRGIYPYRDWVIRAFNKNLPMDDFITWQLAGDLLPHPTLEQRVATGFVRMNPTTSEGGALAEEFQAKNNFDRTETFGTVLLGSSLICARCHTHKYDPIPQTEYYRLMAFFNSTAEPSMDGNKYVYGPNIKAPVNQSGWDAWDAWVGARDDLLAEARANVGEKTLSGLKTWQGLDGDARLGLLARKDGPLSNLGLGERAAELQKRSVEIQKSFTTTLIAQDLPKPRKTRVLARGEYNLPIGDPLEPGILQVMGPFPKNAPRNRLGLARWLTSRDHPLTARVLINRVWQRVFGVGLVRTPEDFGLQGQQPTHPELLDWLAVELQDSGWDLEHMLKLMVTSRTFRQSSAWRKDVDDPENRLFARGPGHRLDAEVIRDVALWSSGLLDEERGGEGVKPYQPGGLWSALAHPASNTKKYVRDKGKKVYRRSIYMYWKRTSPPPIMMLFDAPSREASCVRRSRTNTSLQSLGLFNETQRLEMARSLAERLLHETKDDTQRLNALFRLVACRKPTENERTACLGLLKHLRARYEASEKDALALLSLGDAPRDKTLNPAAHASWSQLAITVLASDVTILLY